MIARDQKNNEPDTKSEKEGTRYTSGIEYNDEV